MSARNSFRIISVTGAHSKVGKTTLCSILLQNLRGFGAIKFTKTALYTLVTDDPETIIQGDKDTAIMSRSGAKKVVWVRSPANGLEDALNIAMSKMEGLEGVIVEGNSPLDFLNPHLVIFIIRQAGKIKPSAAGVSRRADIIIVNSEKEGVAPSIPSGLLQKNRALYSMDLMNKKGEIDKFLAHVKKYIVDKG